MTCIDEKSDGYGLYFWGYGPGVLKFLCNWFRNFRIEGLDIKEIWLWRNDYLSVFVLKDIFIPSPSLEERSNDEKKGRDLHSSSLTVECSKASETEPKNSTEDLGLSLTGDSCKLMLSTSEYSQC